MPSAGLLEEGEFQVERSTLKPFLRMGLDILFVGLNPARGSSRKGHYFSVNAAFWNQLLEAGLICEPVDKNVADDIVFGSTQINRNGWNYGITDLVTSYAESDSRIIQATTEDCSRLVGDIRKYQPRVVILLHGKVLDSVGKFLRIPMKGQFGQLGRLIQDAPSQFFSVPFPHGNAIPAAYKVQIYRRVIEFLDQPGGAAARSDVIHESQIDRASVQGRRDSAPKNEVGAKNEVTGGSVNQRSVLSPRIELAQKIDKLIEKYLRQSGADTLKPKDLMPLLVAEGIFVKDHKEGLLLRNLLRELHTSGQLSVMRTVSFVQGPKNKSWYFRLPR